MNVRVGGLAALVVTLPCLPDLPEPSPQALLGIKALCARAGSASVAEIHAVAGYLDLLAAHDGMPAEARAVLIIARDALLGRRVRNQHGRTGRRTGRGAGSGSGGILFTLTAAAGVAVG